MSVLLLTGVPGSGKTTVLRRAAATLRERWRLGGFYTEEIREAGVARRGGEFIVEVKRRPDAELRTLTRATRDAAPAAIADWVARHARRRRA